MNSPTCLTIALVALPALSSGLRDIAIEYDSGLSYEMRTERTRTLRLGETSMFVGGEEFPSGMLDESVPDRDESETLIVRDVVREAKSGRPVHVVREFVELTKEKTEQEELTKESGALEGWKLVLSLGDDDEVEAKPEGDGKATIDRLYLEGHRLEHRIYSIMPDSDVEPGDSWTPDGEAIRSLLLSDGPNYYEPESNRNLTSLLNDVAECTAEVTLQERAQLDGVECFLLHVEGKIDATIDELPEHLKSGGSESKEGSIEVGGKFQAELWIAAEERFPVRLEVTSDMTFDVEMVMDHQGMTVETNLELLVKSTAETEWEITQSAK